MDAKDKDKKAPIDPLTEHLYEEIGPDEQKEYKVFGDEIKEKNNKRKTTFWNTEHNAKRRKIGKGKGGKGGKNTNGKGKGKGNRKGNKGKGNGNCYACGQPWHLARYCPNRGQ